jgi:ankyrin repeat protein
MTDLHHAAYCNDPDEVRAQLLKHANVHARDDNGWSPLHWSIDMAQSGFGEPRLVVSLLLAAGASANATDDSGFSVLMMACGRNNVDILDQLLQAGADIHLRSTLGITALHEAASCNFVEGIQRLLQLGASLEAVDNWNRTPEEVAIAYEWDDCAAILKAARQNA